MSPTSSVPHPSSLGSVDSALSTQDSGLYVHVPFCARQCPYCDFAIDVGAREEFRARYVAALQRELRRALELHSTESSNEPIATIFFGGGTPTLLAGEQLAAILDAVRDAVDVASDAEVSIEANPELLDSAKLATMREAGFNRLSLGAQSFDTDALRRLGRAHSGEHIAAAVAAARDAGFGDIGLDLIYAVPGQPRESWRATLQCALDLEPEHVSCYSLTIEPETPFGKRVRAGRLLPVADEAQADLMGDAEELLLAGGLARYEISNYARPGHACRHNENYWRGGNYLAAGCGAHGHRDGHRWWNVRGAADYVDHIESGASPLAGEEFLTPRQRLDEIVMLGVRTSRGFDIEAAERALQIPVRSLLGEALQRLRNEGLLKEENGVVTLAPRAFVIADAVAARLLG